MSEAEQAHAATFVIFGAMGDLTKRLLMPALVNLQHAHLLAPATKILGIGHGGGSDAALRESLASFVKEGADFHKLANAATYLGGEFEDAALYAEIAKAVSGNVVFYLATAPQFFGPIVEALGQAGLFDEKDGFRRVVIEKPFGTDAKSAHALNERILAHAREDQVYRIDHFLGKETVQNIMVARFGNPVIEAVWNSRYIDHVQITAAESVSVGTRGGFYDATGALRDMVPNHLFQLLALVGMEPPNSFDADAVRTEKSKVIAATRAADPKDAVRGRYVAGTAGGQKVPAYLETADVDPKSHTETYVALKLMVDTWRWQGVPFYLRTGKALSARDTEIVIRFRDAPVALFGGGDAGGLPPNQLILQLQPDEGLALEIGAKKPGPLVDVVPISLSFAYKEAFRMRAATGYETLLYDVLIGDQTLFQRADQIEGGWRVVQPLLDAWTRGQPDDYTPGSAGPDAADALLAREGRAWHAIG